MTDLLVIDDRVARGLIKDQRALASIPCLADVVATVKRELAVCRCPSRRAEIEGRTPGRIMTCLRQLSNQQRIKLRQLLKARRVRLFYNAGGKRLMLTW
jgi:hypothetical protein